MAPLERWNDERLDDLARRVDDAVRIRDKLTALEIEFVRMRGQSELCLDEVRRIRKGQDEERAHREEREDEMRKERKSDRKYAVTTAIAVLVLVVGALALFLG